MPRNAAGPGKPPSPGTGETYARLKELIYLGDIPPGSHLVETTLANEFRVSRTPVREALTRLEQDGLVIRSSVGLVVRERTTAEILDIYTIRILLEEEVARTAAVRNNEADLIALRQAQRRYEAAPRSDPQRRVLMNREFHRAVWQAAHQDTLFDLVQRIEAQLGRFPLTTIMHPGRWEETIAEHRELIAAIAERDSARAARAARGHFANAREIRLELWEAAD